MKIMHCDPTTLKRKWTGLKLITVTGCHTYTASNNPDNVLFFQEHSKNTQIQVNIFRES